jgi:ABC-type uncharacterized transport system ATPase subunit
MSDKDSRAPIQQAEDELIAARQRVDEQLQIVHRLEAAGRDDNEAQRKLETLLEALEIAQQRHKSLHRGNQG